ncbi:unnamed protein product [Closterium sp. NIES-53]
MTGEPLLEFVAACRLDYATALVAVSASASPPSVGGECALGTNVLEDRQEDFECLPAAGVDYFQTFSPTQKRTTLRVLLLVAAQRDYELHSLEFSTAFLQVSLHEEIWLRRPPGFTGSFPAGTQWSLRRPVNGLRQAAREWHNTLRTTLAALGFAPSTADPSLSSCEAEIYARAMAAQELRWLTYLLTDLGEQPRAPPVLSVASFVSRTWTATRANTADVFTKALPPGDHQRFATLLGLVPTLPHLLTA